ncbi:MAG: GAF domain-containing sensor histidine kinase, partial [Afipia sp.]|nr:GAF domain-containing sensor histidine kinase [Afipia sp.]
MNFEDDIAAVRRIDAVHRILEVVCRTTGMGFAAVARVTEERWVCCAVRDEISFGLEPGGELKVETTICHEIRQHQKAVVINNVAEDGTYCGHQTPAMYGFQSYISMPIKRKDGTFFGTLCAIDPKPAKLNTLEVVGMFELFAELIGTHLDAIEQLSSSEANLLDERATAELREQFIAVLGHDLRNPLASLSSGVNLIQKAKSAERAAEIGVAMQSSVKRMARLIDDLLDFARGRLGGGLALNYDKELLALVLDQVVAELRAGYPDRNIEAAFALTQEVRCDSGRVAQLLSNHLGNALKYGGPDTPVRVEATIGQGEFELSVINKGAP